MAHLKSVFDGAEFGEVGHSQNVGVSRFRCYIGELGLGSDVAYTDDENVDTVCPGSRSGGLCRFWFVGLAVSHDDSDVGDPWPVSVSGLAGGGVKVKC